MSGTAHTALIGLRGSGKSTLGRAVARLLSLNFIDLDDVTPDVLGEANAADALRRHGEPAFRLAEMQALRTVLQEGRAPALIALGGGSPTAPGFEACAVEHNMRLIYLRCAPATLRSRLQATDTETRPSLTGRGTLDEIDAVFAKRDPAYVELAHDVVECDDLSEASLVERLAQMLARPTG